MCQPILAASLVILSLAASVHAAGADMTAGFAEADITPALGMEQPGGYGKSYHSSIHDPCKVRAAVLDDGNQLVAIVGVDGIGIHRETVVPARQRIEAQCGIPAESIMIAASHSHSSGPISGVLPGQYDDASDLIRQLAYEKSTCVDAKYMKQVENQIVDAVCRAYARRAPAQCGAGVGVEEQVAFNRRFRMKGGVCFTHPRPGNPDTLEPAGPTDPTVAVIGAWDENGNLLGCVVNFSCHATTSPGGASANYIYYLEEVIRGAFGEDVIVVFVPGFSGDVTQVDNLTKYASPGREQWAKLVGGCVGAEAIKVLYRMEPGRLAPLKAKTTTLQIPRRSPSPERVRRCLTLVQKDPNQVGATEWTFAKEIVMLDYLLSKRKAVEVELQAIQVGPVVLLGAPGEMFCQLGLDAKARSPFPMTMPVSFANGTCGYVPTEEALSDGGGGYETRLTSYSNLEPAAGSKMVAALGELAEEFQPGKIPTRDPAPPFRGPWSYGNVPPELD